MAGRREGGRAPKRKLAQSVLPVEPRDCAICLERLNQSTIQRLVCSHIFHERCVSRWLRRHPTCPVCRKKVRLERPVNLPIRRVLERPVDQPMHHRVQERPADPPIHQVQVRQERPVDPPIHRVRERPIDPPIQLQAANSDSSQANVRQTFHSNVPVGGSNLYRRRTRIVVRGLRPRISIHRVGQILRGQASLQSDNPIPECFLHDVRQMLDAASNDILQAFRQATDGLAAEVITALRSRTTSRDSDDSDDSDDSV